MCEVTGKIYFLNVRLAFWAIMTAFFASPGYIIYSIKGLLLQKNDLDVSALLLIQLTVTVYVLFGYCEATGGEILSNQVSYK